MSASTSRLRPILAALFALAAIGGCARDDRYELLSVEALETSRLDAGRTITITGEGFPVGREVEVLVRGVLHAPLGARRRVLHTLVGRTVTPEHLELTVSDADVATLGGRGTFVGSLEVVVHGASVDGLSARVVGVLDDVTLDVVPSERRGLVHDRGRDEGEELASVLGLEISPDEDAAIDDEASADDDALDEEADPSAAGPRGARVLAVDPNGPAARLGLETSGLSAGARIVAIDGLRVLDPREARLDPRASRTTLGLLRSDGREATLVVDLDAARGRPTDRSTRHDQLAIVVLVAAFLFGTWPWSSPRAARHASRAPREAKPLAAILTAALALVVVLAASTLWAGSVSETVIPAWLAVALFLRASATLATSESTGSEREGSRPSVVRRLPGVLWRLVRRESWISLVSALATTVAIGVFVTARGSAESASLPVLGGPLASAPWMPMSWALVRAPFGPFALAAILAAASATSTGIASPRTRSERLLRGLDDLGLAALASVFVRVTLADPSSTDLATRATALVATIALFLALLSARSLAPGARWGPSVASAIASVATLLVAAAWLGLGPSATDGASEQAVAEVVLVSVGLVIVRVASLGRERAPGGIAPPGLRRSASEGPNSPTIVA
jgi:hypothetical protein